MAKPNYSAGKRQREADKLRRREEKAHRRENRDSRRREIPVTTADSIQGGEMLSIDEVVEQAVARPTGQERARSMPVRLFIGGLGQDISGDELRAAFEVVGPVSDAVVVLDRDTGDSRGFGFVTMADRKDAAEAIRKLNGEVLGGRTLVVKQATER